MLTALVVLTFSGGFAAAIIAIGLTVASRIDRIVSALRGIPAQQFAPLATLAQAENRIAVRRWAAQSAPAVSRVRLRAAA